MHKGIFIIICCFMFSAIGNTQECISFFSYSKDDISRVRLCPEAMKADIEQLHEHILNTHPNPTLYCGVDAFVKAYKQALVACETDKTMIEFIQIVNKYLAIMKDSHTNLNARDFLYLGPKDRAVLPFFVVKIDDKFYLEGVYKNDVSVGSEILSIDAFSIDSLYELSKILSFSEGNAIQARDEIAQSMIGASYNLIHHAKLEDKAAIRLVNLKGDTVLVEASFVKSSTYLKDREGKRPKPIRYFIDGQNRCVLTIESFDPYSLKKFKKRIDKCFAEIKEKEINELYIDLRDNLGGMLRAQEYVVSYINEKGDAIQMNYLYKRSKYDRFALLPFYQEWQFKQRAERVYPNGLISEEYDFYKSPLGTTKTILYDYVPKNKLNYTYKGKCTLITNGSSMSASVLFAGWFKMMNRGQIIGTSCMGGVCGTFGNSAPYTLNHSQIHLSVSTLKFTPKKTYRIDLNPIKPDQEIHMNRQQLIDRKDPVYEFLQIDPRQKQKKRRITTP